MASHPLVRLVDLVAGLGHDVATILGDPQARDEFLGQAGLPAPAIPPPTSQDAPNLLAALQTKAHAGAQSDQAESLELLAELSDAMIVLVSLVQEAADIDDVDDAWNVLATLLDLVALTRLRLKNPALVAALQALHLVSDDRLMIADLIHARDQWGSFVLGHPEHDQAKADNWSIILAAALTLLSAWIPPDDDQGKVWNADILFGWDPEPSPPHPHATGVLQRMATMVLTHRDGSLEERAGLSAVVVPPADGGWGMFFALELGGGLTFPIGAHLELLLKADVPNAIDAFTGSDIVPAFGEVSGAGAHALIALRRKQESTQHWVIGDEKSTHLEIGTFQVGMELGEPTRFHVAIGDGELDIQQETFGSLVPSEGAKLKFDVDLAVDTKGKWSFVGGAGTTVTTPVNKSVPGLTVHSVTVALAIEDKPEGAAASLSATVAFTVDFFKRVRFSVEGVGAKLAWTPPSSPGPIGGPPPVRGNLGSYGNITPDAVWPRGVGIELDIGPFKGGGFLFIDRPHRTYGGALEGSVDLCGNGIAIKAAGVRRDTDDGWSFIGILSAQFEPGIELFLGATLKGVGGLVGHNVTLDVDKLRAGLHDGAVSRLLFPDDPVANAPAIIETMSAVFPLREGGSAAGVMLQLGWGKPNQFVTLSVGVVVVLPSPVLVVILGRLQITHPTQDLAIIDFKADFVGLISLEEPSVSIDATILQSRIAGYPVTGDVAVRLGGGGWILAFGGFHPRYTPPRPMPAQRRLRIDISPSANAKLRAEAYFAITSNSIQGGLHVALDIDAGAASIHGWLDLDFLWQDDQPRLSVRFDVGLELRVGGSSIAGISADVLVEGTNPWHLQADLSLHLLFFTLHFGYQHTWGEVEPGDTPPEVDVAVRVAQSLSTDGAWSAIAPNGDALVTFRVSDRSEIGVHPYGQLSLRQRTVPLGVAVTRLGASRVTGGSATVLLTPIAGAPASAPTVGLFAAAQFQQLSDDEKLSRPSFEPFQDGISFGAAQTTISAEQLSTGAYETVFIPDQQRRTDGLDPTLLVHALGRGSVARSGLHRAALFDGPDQRVRLADETYRVVAADTLTASGAAPDPFNSATAAYAAAQATGGALLVVAAHEVAS